MSVYKPARSAFWQFDFIIGGKRVHGSTGQTTRRAAEAVERQKRLEAATGQLGKVAKMTFNAAALQWWDEVGIKRGDKVDVERRLTQLVALIGPNVPLGDIDQAAVAEAIERRRGQGRARSPKKGAKVYYPANATVNRDTIEILRPILSHARSHWVKRGTVHGLPDIEWRKLRLSEPRALSRVYSADDKARWIDACDEDVRLALEMLLTYGLRFGELFFPPAALSLDPIEPTLTLQKGRKRDVILHVPIRHDHARALAARHSRAVACGLDHLWYFEGRKGPTLYTPSMVEYRISKAADAAGVSGGRRIHGARHHAASAVLKRTGNLKAVQALLGHATITSSQRYAHVLTADLRAAVEDETCEVPRYSPEVAKDDDDQSQAG
jgi:integrase